MNVTVLTSILVIATTVLSLAQEANADTTASGLTCADFNPTQEALDRFPDLKGSCEGIVERDGELYAKTTAYVHRVTRAGTIWLHLPATDHTFKVSPGPDARILIGDTKARVGELVKGQDVRIYLAVSEFGKPNVESIAFISDDDLILDHMTEGGDIVDKPGRVLTSVVRTGAIIEAIDYETREVDLIGADGAHFRVVAQENITDIENINVRDRVIIEYLESVAVIMAPEGSEPLIGDGVKLRIAGRGTDEPEMSGVTTHLLVAHVESINTTNMTAVVRLEDDTRRLINISEDAPLDMINIGDQMRLRVTRAMAVSIEKPTS
jgi:hypothetical protein